MELSEKVKTWNLNLMIKQIKMWDTEMGESAWNYKNFDVYLDSQRFRFLKKSSYPVCTILNPDFNEISLKFREILLCT
jgi:hypothetical protein